MRWDAARIGGVAPSCDGAVADLRDRGAGA